MAWLDSKLVAASRELASEIWSPDAHAPAPCSPALILTLYQLDGKTAEYRLLGRYCRSIESTPGVQHQRVSRTERTPSRKNLLSIRDTNMCLERNGNFFTGDDHGGMDFGISDDRRNTLRQENQPQIH